MPRGIERPFLASRRRFRAVSSLRHSRRRTTRADRAEVPSKSARFPRKFRENSMKVPGTGLPDLEGRTGRTYGGGRPTCSFHHARALGKISKWAAHPRRPPSKSGRPVPGTFMEISRKCPKEAQKASTLPRHLCPVGANGAMTKRHETVVAIAKRPLDAPRYYSGHGEGPASSIRPPSHA